MNRLDLSAALAAILTCLTAACADASRDETDIRLYALDCGAIEVSDMAPFSRDGAFSGQSYSLANPCFLIRHPDGDLLWDTGFDESLADEPNGMATTGFRSSMARKLSDQLAELGLTMSDIEFVAISHSHPDHAGNAYRFTQATFLVSAAEHAFMLSDAGAQFGPFDWLETLKTVRYEFEMDVFGDGAVVIRTLPGHTPGSAVLLLRLDNAGPLLFSGDLFTHAAGRANGSVPVFNVDAERTRKSIVEFESLAEAEGARVIVQHEPSDFHGLPAFPAWLD